MRQKSVHSHSGEHELFVPIEYSPGNGVQTFAEIGANGSFSATFLVDLTALSWQVIVRQYEFQEKDLPISPNARLGARTIIPHPDLVNIYGCIVGDDTFVGPFVEIQSGSNIGRFCKIQSHSFICEGVDIADEVFVGHGVMFTNDFLPRATDERGQRITDDWTLSRTIVELRASIGSGSVVLPVRIGKSALIGAGSVVTHDVPSYAIVAGNPARVIGDIRDKRKTADVDR